MSKNRMVFIKQQTKMWFETYKIKWLQSKQKGCDWYQNESVVIGNIFITKCTPNDLAIQCSINQNPCTACYPCSFQSMIRIEIKQCGMCRTKFTYLSDRQKYIQWFACVEHSKYCAYLAWVCWLHMSQFGNVIRL